jgi:hypothetical protein
MTRILFAAAALTLVGIGAVQSAPRSKGRQGAGAPARLQGPVAIPTRPAWAAPGECFTDDGYGRFRPCSSDGRAD